MKDHFNVCLMGCSLSTRNRGVSALCSSLVKLTLECRPEARITLMIGDRTGKAQKVVVFDTQHELYVENFRMSLASAFDKHLFTIVFLAFIHRIIPFQWARSRIANSNSWLKTLDTADFVGDIRGGDSFSDIYGVARFLLGSLPGISALLMRKRLHLLPQTYGPYKSFVSQSVAAWIIRQAERVMSRDDESLKVVRDLSKGNAGTDKFIFCPDVALVLDVKVPESVDTDPPGLAKGKQPIIGLNINGLMFNGGYSRGNMFGLKLDYQTFLTELLETLYEATDAQVLLIPHTFALPGDVNSDPDACRQVMNSVPVACRSRVHLITRQFDQSEIKGVIGSCDFFVGSRMHSCIAALSQGICTVGVAYSKKFMGVFQSLGCQNLVIDGRTVTTGEAVERVIEAYETRTETAPSIQEAVSRAQRTIRNHLSRILMA